MDRAAAALVLLEALERRGASVTTEGQRVRIRPMTALTGPECALVEEYRLELWVMVDVPVVDWGCIRRLLDDSTYCWQGPGDRGFGCDGNHWHRESGGWVGKRATRYIPLRRSI